MGKLNSDNQAPTGEAFDGYPNAHYTRQRPKPPAGTLVMRPIPTQVGHDAGGHPRYEIRDYHLFVVDAAGRLHAIFGFELTRAEVGARCVRDPQRLALLCDPLRHQARPEPAIPAEFLDLVDADGAPKKGAMTKLLARLMAKIAMPGEVQNTLVQREPGEEG